MSLLRQERSSHSQRRGVNASEECKLFPKPKTHLEQEQVGSRPGNEKPSSQSLRQTHSQQSHKQQLAEEDPKLALAPVSQGELKKVLGEGRLDEYGEEEEEIVCLRFPHLQFCPHNYQAQLRGTIFAEVIEGVYLCGFAAGLATKFLLAKGVTHILNVTATEYTKRTKYFRYLTLDVFNTSDEDIKKHFRITNRFIKTVCFYHIHDFRKEPRGKRQGAHPLNGRSQHWAMFHPVLHDQQPQDPAKSGH